MENKTTQEAQDKMPRLTQKQRWSVVADYIRKTDADELLILKTLWSESADDISLSKFDDLTVAAINAALKREADTAAIEDVADMVSHRVENAIRLSAKFAKSITGKQHSRLMQVLMDAARSKSDAKAAFARLTEK